MSPEEIVERSLPFVQPHYRENIKIQIQAAINVAIQAAYEDAAKVVEKERASLDEKQKDSYSNGLRDACEQISLAIRDRSKAVMGGK